MKGITVAIVLSLTAGAALQRLSASTFARPDRHGLAFQTNAAGSAAYWSGRWRISSPSPGTGVIVGAAVCDDEAFLLDRGRAVVHRVNLTRGRIDASFGGAASLDGVEGLAADCSNGRVYVTDTNGVSAFDTGSGTLLARLRKPAGFVIGAGAPVIGADGETLYVPGLMPATPGDWFGKPVDRMFDGDRLGYQLDLRSGATLPMLPAPERGCWSLGPNCLYATLDAIDSPAGPAFVAAHRVGIRAGLYDRQFRLIRTIDVRSPLFRESGLRNGSQDIRDMVAWNEDNSVIRRVYGFGDMIVAVHSHNRTFGWQPKQPIEFDVFMNVHRVDGIGIASDVRLPDLPVGRDARSLYVIDYGVGGRARAGHGEFTLVSIPVIQ